MTQHNGLNVKLSNSQLNKFKSATKNATEVTLNLSSDIVSKSNYEPNFMYKLWLTDIQVSKLRKAFVNNSSANIKLLKTQLSKIVKLGGFLDRLPIPLLKTGLLFMKNILKP